jgi:sugar transferase (PEP-CTERM system associated)
MVPITTGIRPLPSKSVKNRYWSSLMVRVFQVYYPKRTILLFSGEAVFFCAAFVLAVWLQRTPNFLTALMHQSAFVKILAVDAFALGFSYLLDLYEPQRLKSGRDMYCRLMLVLGVLSFVLSGVVLLVPRYLPGQNTSLIGMLILTVFLLGWRSLYEWLTNRPFFKERVCVIGGDRATRVAKALGERRDFGFEVVGFDSPSSDEQALALDVYSMAASHDIRRVIVAISERRGNLPIEQLLGLRLNGIQVEADGAILERVLGKISTSELRPSDLIFSEGFRLNRLVLFLRRLLSILAAVILLIGVLPLIPVVALAIKLSSPGPLLYSQKRVGYRGKIFHCYKFRTMRPDAEADTGPTWASDTDPRITRIGRFLRATRIDEIPQLWNVLRGDMSFVGPRPERPEFVELLTREIPFYPLRHSIPPGITGWAQVRYKYGNSVADAQEKLNYDLYYIKNLSLGFDLTILLRTVKTILRQHGV